MGNNKPDGKPKKTYGKDSLPSKKKPIPMPVIKSPKTRITKTSE